MKIHFSIKKIALGLIIICAMSLLGGVVVLGYYGFVPVVSDLFGSNKPIDLGVSFNDTNTQDAIKKTGINFEYIQPTDKPEESLKFSGETAINTSFTSNELSALIANDKWKYNFLKNTQIKINDDGTSEISTGINTELLGGFAAAHGIEEDQIKPLIDQLKMANSPPVYIKLAASWSNNSLKMDIQKIEIGRYLMDRDWIDKNESTITSQIENSILRTPGVSITSLTFLNGEMQYNGTLPDKIQWAIN